MPTVSERMFLLEHKIFEKIVNDIVNYDMIHTGDKILVGLSGGADSVFLLYALMMLRDKFRIKVCAAHVNHGIRGNEAIKDQIFSEKLCNKLDITFFTENFNVPEYAKTNKLSDEEAGRKVRYSYFTKLCSMHNCDKIAVAHNMNDSVETVVLNLIRGCSLNGFRGIQPKNGNIIRPIIGISREEIETFLADNNIDYCTDSTNSQNIYSRNIVRNCIVNSMKEINPSVLKTIYSNIPSYKDDEDFITEYANSLYCIHDSDDGVIIDRNIFDKQHNSVKRRIIYKAFVLLWGDALNLEKKHIDILIDFLHSGQSFDMPRNCVAKVSSDTILIAHKRKVSFDFEFAMKPGDLINVIPGIKCKSMFTEKANFDEKNSVYIDFDKIKYGISIRNKRDGDKFVPYGMDSYKKLKNFFVDLKIPVYERNKVPIICDGEEVVAVLPYRISNHYKLDNTTNKILKIQIIKEDLK